MQARVVAFAAFTLLPSIETSRFVDVDYVMFVCLYQDVVAYKINIILYIYIKLIQNKTV